MKRMCKRGLAALVAVLLLCSALAPGTLAAGSNSASQACQAILRTIHASVLSTIAETYPRPLIIGRQKHYSGGRVIHLNVSIAFLRLVDIFFAAIYRFNHFCFWTGIRGEFVVVNGVINFSKRRSICQSFLFRVLHIAKQTAYK